MKIEAYSFGSITIKGKTYKKDLIVFPDKVTPEWWRQDGHSLCMDDLEEVLAFAPDILVVGRGAFGIMKVPSDTQKAIEAAGIVVISEKTGDAWHTYNSLAEKGEKVVGAFHLTC